MALVQNAEQLRNEWLIRLADLVQFVSDWAKANDWSTRQIEVTLSDPEIGRHQAPCLILQQETFRVMMEPIARSAPGAEGVVNLYLMPAYDDIANLYFYEGAWHVVYMFPVEPIENAVYDATALPLTAETLQKVLAEMKQHVAESA